MFTGIIEEIGTIKSIEIGTNYHQITIKSDNLINDIKVGDSISVNGVCLTVSSLSSDAFQADVMPETVSKTSLTSLKTGSSVNLERAMSANGRFGGHFVYGHIDNIGKIIEKKNQGNAIIFRILIPKNFGNLIVPKGSIAVDGISLTVVETGIDYFTISIIPHTLENTILGNRDVGDVVNLEFDMLARYVNNYLKNRFGNQDTGIQPISQLSKSFLEKNGFI